MAGDRKPLDTRYRAARIAALRRGQEQWGHAGRHHGNGSPDCPRELHHHHDFLCEWPTPGECAAAGVEWREPHNWGSRA